MSSALDAPTLPWITRTRSTLEQLWERIDKALLRLQGRLDTPGYDRGLPYAFALLLGAAFIAIALARHNSMLLGAETAKFSQATWQIGEGLRPITSLSGGHVIAEQGSLILYPLALLTSILPRVETLLIIKALALAIAVIPLWRLARSHGRLGIGATTVVVVVYGHYTAVQAMNAADFAPAILAVPALMWAVLFGFEERQRLMIAAILFVLCCRADLGLAVAGFGVLLMLERRRRLGTIATLLGIGWFLIAIYGLQPWLGDGSFGFLEPYAAFGETPLRALWGIVSHPVRFAQTVGSVANFKVWVSLFAPVLFLPLTAPRYLLPGVPLYVLYMGANVETGRLREAAQTVPVTVFVFVATVFALQRAGRTLVKRVRVERRIVTALLLTGVVFFIRDSPTSPYNQPWEWGDRDGTDQRLEAIDELPGIDVPVRASASLLPLLSERLGVYALDARSGETIHDKAALAVDGVDWLLLDRDADADGLEDADVLLFNASVTQLGWERIEQGADARVEVYHFTGIISSPDVGETIETPAPAPEPDDG